jgi:hypothetical protein
MPIRICAAGAALLFAIALEGSAGAATIKGPKVLAEAQAVRTDTITPRLYLLTELLMRLPAARTQK